MRAGIYVRISQDRTGAGLGVQRQEDDCRQLAARLGWDVVEVFVDNDVSASTGKARPAYRRLISEIEAGTVQAVLTWHTDRLHRMPRELESYVDVCEPRGVTTRTVQAGEVDLSNPTGRMVARILGAVARQEVEHKADRTRRAQRQAAEAGRWLGGGRPFGWSMDHPAPAPHDVEAPMVRDACAHVLAGGSLGAVAARWNTAGVTSTLGKRWTATTIRQVLLRARNAGLATWQGDVVGASTFPALVSEDTWRAVSAILRDPGRRRSASTTSRWLLSGIARCECGQTVRSATVKNRDGSARTVYRCRATGAGHVYINAAESDAFVVDVVAAILGREALPTLEPDTEDLTAQASGLRARLEEASTDYYVHGRLERAQWERINDQLTAALTAAEGRIAQQAAAGVLEAYAGADGARRWRAADLDVQRTVLRRLADVTITRSGRGPRSFDPSRVQVAAAARALDASGR